jgi:hypothetical protein
VLFAGAQAHVVVARTGPDALEHAALARIAVPDDVLRGAVDAYERHEPDERHAGDPRADGARRHLGVAAV